METLRILAVCTGNTCRSPMAAALLAVHLADVGVPAVVESAGTLGWNDRGASPHAVEVMAERGLDLRGHVSRRLADVSLDVDLVLAMTRTHAGAVIARDETLIPCVFLPAELNRLLTAAGDGGDQGVDSARVGMAQRVRAVGAARRGPVIGRAADEIADPAGEPIDVYRSVVTRLDRELRALAAVLAR